MVAMTVVLVVGAIAALGAVVVGATWRRSADERQSVRDYHQTLETLRHLSDRNLGNGVREAPGQAPSGPQRQPGPARRDHEPAQGRSQGGSTTTGGAEPTSDPLAPVGPPTDSASGVQASSRSGTLVGRSGPVRSGNAAYIAARTRDAGTDKTMLFDDDIAEPSPIAPSTTVSVLASGRALYRQRRPAHSGSPLQPRRRSLLTVVVVVVLAAVVAVALVLAPSKPSHRHGATSTHTTSAHSSSRSTGSSSSSQKHKSPTTASQTLQPTTSSATSAAYLAPASAYTVGLSTSGPCWVLATAASTGKVLWTGTMQAGESRQIPATGSLLVRLGADDVTMSLNGEPVTLPAGHQSPFDVTFQSA
ncbi:MAG: DUF4115 domain-containing protein [Acidimicrobiales bacterium]